MKLDNLQGDAAKGKSDPESDSLGILNQNMPQPAELNLVSLADLAKLGSATVAKATVAAEAGALTVTETQLAKAAETRVLAEQALGFPRYWTNSSKPEIDNAAEIIKNAMKDIDKPVVLNEFENRIATHQKALTGNMMYYSLYRAVVKAAPDNATEINTFLNGGVPYKAARPGDLFRAMLFLKSGVYLPPF